MGKSNIVYPYIPNSAPEVKAEMMKEVGVTDVMQLYEEIPEALKFKGKLNLPEPIMDEYSIKRHTEAILAKNKNCVEYTSFLGAGCAQHFVPAVCDEMLGRGEFLTCYGAETWADHGKNQVHFEYQSLMAELLDMDFLTTTCHDGAQAVATGLCMCNRINGRKKVLLPKTMNPQTLVIVRNYLKSVHLENALEIVLIDYDKKTGLMDLDDLKAKISNDVSAVFIENPTYLGSLEVNAAQIGAIAKEAGAEFLVCVDPISLGVIEAPANYGATITVGDIHSLGLHLYCGGASGGFIATFDDMKYMSETKELVHGLTETTVEGEYGFGMVMIERTHYALREKGNEFTGTTSNLWMIPAATYLSLMGPKGMEEVGNTIMKNATYAAKKIAEIPGLSIQFSSPFFKEFIVNFDKTGKTIAEVNNNLLNQKIFSGYDVSEEFPELGQSALFCVTEIHTKEDIDNLVSSLKNAVC